eukprot:gene3888-2759_t
MCLCSCVRGECHLLPLLLTFVYSFPFCCALDSIVFFFSCSPVRQSVPIRFLSYLIALLHFIFFLKSTEESMASERFWFRFKIGLYVVCIVAYLVAFVDFLVEWKNYWACAGYMIAALLMSLRLWMFVTPTETLYKIFPLGSVRRAAFQGFFLCVGFALLIIGFWLIAKGAQRSQPWTGESYYCSMIGIWCAAKWGFFITVPIYNLRPDITDPDYLDKIAAEKLSPTPERQSDTFNPLKGMDNHSERLNDNLGSVSVVKHILPVSETNPGRCDDVGRKSIAVWFLLPHQYTSKSNKYEMHRSRVRPAYPDLLYVSIKTNQLLLFQLQTMISFYMKVIQTHCASHSFPNELPLSVDILSCFLLSLHLSLSSLFNISALNVVTSNMFRCLVVCIMICFALWRQPLEAEVPSRTSPCPSKPLCGSRLTYKGKIFCHLKRNPLALDSSEYEQYALGRLEQLDTHFVLGQKAVLQIRDEVIHKLRHKSEPMVLHFVGDNGVGKTRTAEAISLALGQRCHPSDTYTCQIGDSTLVLHGSTMNGLTEEAFRKHVISKVVPHAKRYPKLGVVIINDFNAMKKKWMVHILLPLLQGTAFIENSDVALSGQLVILTTDMGKEGKSIGLSAKEISAKAHQHFTSEYHNVAAQALVTYPFFPATTHMIEDVTALGVRLLGCKYGVNISVDDETIKAITERFKKSSGVLRENYRFVSQELPSVVEPMLLRSLSENKNLLMRDTVVELGVQDLLRFSIHNDR